MCTRTVSVAGVDPVIEENCGEDVGSNGGLKYPSLSISVDARNRDVDNFEVF